MSERAVEARTEIAWLRVALAELLDVGHPGHRVGTGKECKCVVHENARNLLRAANLAATEPADGLRLDFDRLLAAIEATRLEDPGPWHVDFPKTRTRLAKEIGRNYRALATPTTPEPDQ